MLRESQEVLHSQTLRTTGSKETQETLGTSRRGISDEQKMVPWESLNDLMRKVEIKGQRHGKTSKLNIQRNVGVIQGNYRNWIKKDRKSDGRVFSNVGD